MMKRGALAPALLLNGDLSARGSRSQSRLQAYLFCVFPREFLRKGDRSLSRPASGDGRGRGQKGAGGGEVFYSHHSSTIRIKIFCA